MVEQSLPSPLHKATGPRRRPPHVAVARIRTVCQHCRNKRGRVSQLAHRVASAACGSYDKPVVNKCNPFCHFTNAVARLFRLLLGLVASAIGRHFQGCSPLSIMPRASAYEQSRRGFFLFRPLFCLFGTGAQRSWGQESVLDHGPTPESVLALNSPLDIPFLPARPVYSGLHLAARQSA